MNRPSSALVALLIVLGVIIGAAAIGGLVFAVIDRLDLGIWHWDAVAGGAIVGVGVLFIYGVGKYHDHAG